MCILFNLWFYYLIYSYSDLHFLSFSNLINYLEAHLFKRFQKLSSFSKCYFFILLFIVIYIFNSPVLFISFLGAEWLEKFHFLLFNTVNVEDCGFSYDTAVLFIHLKTPLWSIFPACSFSPFHLQAWAATDTFSQYKHPAVALRVSVLQSWRGLKI